MLLDLYLYSTQRSYFEIFQDQNVEPSTHGRQVKANGFISEWSLTVQLGLLYLLNNFVWSV